MLGVVVRQSAKDLSLRFPTFLEEAQPFYPERQAREPPGGGLNCRQSRFRGRDEKEAPIVPGRRTREGRRARGRAGGLYQHRLLSLVSRENEAGADRGCSLLHRSRFPRPAKTVSSTPVSNQERSRNGSPSDLPSLIRGATLRSGRGNWTFWVFFEDVSPLIKKLIQLLSTLFLSSDTFTIRI